MSQEREGEVDTTAEETRSRLEWKHSKEGREVIITSMDVIALYPNLRIERCAEEVGKEIEETEVEYENIDYRMGGKFIASNMSQADIDREGLGRIVPKRKSKFGTRPGGDTKELYVKRKYGDGGEEIEGETKWVEVRGTLTRKDNRRILRKVVEIGIRTLMRNHI